MVTPSSRSITPSACMIGSKANWSPLRVALGSDGARRKFYDGVCWQAHRHAARGTTFATALRTTCFLSIMTKSRANFMEEGWTPSQGTIQSPSPARSSLCLRRPVVLLFAGIGDVDGIPRMGQRGYIAQAVFHGLCRFTSRDRNGSVEGVESCLTRHARVACATLRCGCYSTR